MPNKKDMKSGSQSNMGDKPDSEFHNPSSNPSSGKTGQSGKQAGGSQRNTEDDDMKTSGGRQGEFSDTSGGKKGQWSPGSSGSSDR